MQDTNLARITDDFYVSHWQGLVFWLSAGLSDGQLPVCLLLGC